MKGALGTFRACNLTQGAGPIPHGLALRKLIHREIDDGPVKTAGTAGGLTEIYAITTADVLINPDSRSAPGSGKHCSDGTCETSLSLRILITQALE